MSNLYVSYDDLLSVMSREKLDTLPTIDLSVIDEMIEELDESQDKELNSSI